MNWNKYYTSPSHSATFVFGELCYKKPIEITKEITGVHDSYVSYVSRKEGVLSEHTRYSEDDRKGIFGHDYFLDKRNFDHYFETTLAIVSATDDYKRYVETFDFELVTKEDLLEMVKKAEPIYNKSMGYYFLSQPEYTAKLKDEFIDDLKRFVPDESVYEIFTKLVESGEKSCLEAERDAWLTQIILPFLKKEIERPEADESIARHSEKYKYLSASAQFGLWDVQHYEKLFSDDIKNSIEKLSDEIILIENKKNRVAEEKDKITKKYGIPQELVNNIQILADLGWLRLEAHIRGWQFFQWFGAILAKRAANVLDAEEVDVFNLTYSEFVKLLKRDLLIDEKIRSRRSGDILVIITPENGEEIYFSEEASKKYDSEIAEKLEKSDEFKGQTANGKGIVRGKAYVFKWGESEIENKIYEFPDGYILVAGQTLPLFMPAIRKALAIVTNEGGVLCHAAIVSRELNKPAIIGTKVATTLIKSGDVIELDLDAQMVRIIEKNAVDKV
ncbi:MAG: hypothetical protein HGA31_03295 [Candidatus Moranbacteria bacterium]|nr:hypothetical protein [Candidatus Moranbacteria bacterium]